MELRAFTDMEIDKRNPKTEYSVKTPSVDM